MSNSSSKSTEPRRRLHVPDLAAGDLRLDEAGSHYVREVLRLGRGDELMLFDGHGRVARARITVVERGEVVVSVAAPERRESAARFITVGMATPKGERADWAVEKLTELGVARIVWLDCTRSVVRPRGGGRAERWARIAAAAAQQSGRADVPVIDGPVPVAAAAELQGELRVAGDISGEPLLALARGRDFARAVLLIGPEGGFDAGELVQLADARYTLARLGPWTLRVETAAVAGTAMLLGE